VSAGLDPDADGSPSAFPVVVDLELPYLIQGPDSVHCSGTSDQNLILMVSL